MLYCPEWEQALGLHYSPTCTDTSLKIAGARDFSIALEEDEDEMKSEQSSYMSSGTNIATMYCCYTSREPGLADSVCQAVGLCFVLTNAHFLQVRRVGFNSDITRFLQQGTILLANFHAERHR